MTVHTRPLRKASVLGFTAGVALLSMTSSAFACTFFYGKLTVTATRVVNGVTQTSTAFADGNPNAFHSYCPTPAIVDAVSGGGSSIVYPAQAMYKAAMFTVTVGPTTTCGVTQNSLPSSANGTYDVRWLNLTANNLNLLETPVPSPITSPSTPPATTVNLAPNCNLNSLPFQVVGTISIAGGVSAPKTFSQQPTSVGDEVNICVKIPGSGADAPAPPQVKLRMI